jgi:thermolysin
MSRHRLIIAALAGALASWSVSTPRAQSAAPARLARISALGSAQADPERVEGSAASIADLRAWDRRVDSMLASGELRVRTVREDALMPGRRHERADQHYKGVRVYGADVARQIADGQTASIFGVLYDGIDIDTAPALTAEEAKETIEKLSGAALGHSRLPELVILPMEEGFALAYRGRAFSARGLRLYFIDARTGALLLELNDLKTQTAVGRGRGVLGDEKKISVRPQSGTFQAWDELRPPDVRSYDMRGNLGRTIDFLNGLIPLSVSDLATDSDNDWTDAAVVDAHVHSGWTYDYYFKRHNRAGLDNRDIRILSLVHPVRRQDFFSQPDNVIGTFYANAFYAGGGILLYGEGFPPGALLPGFAIDFLSGALDVVAHELSHGVTEFSSNLIYQDESGALNEAFSDIMGTSVEFFFQTPGSGLRQSDYLIAEDVFRPGGIRSMSNPAAYGDPDHYSRRFTGAEDNGGVHTNAGVGNHAFYLAIEGGTNRTSGLAVQGVGGGNREQIEKVFYRAFTQMLPANANFSTARAATSQAARDLYGSGSAAERAVIQAWTAVGVN